jgi:hypothetical protein
MSKLNSGVSHHILSLLEGEKIRVILRDGTTAEGKVVGVSEGELRLSERSIPLDQIATYFVLRGP